MERVHDEGGKDGGARYEMLDAWRGLACLMVVVHHAGSALRRSEIGESWVRWGVFKAVRRMDLGVPLFFVISGYCIAASAEAVARRGDAPWTFLSKRAWRIYPPYWAALLGFALVMGGLDAAGLARFVRNPLGVELDPPWALDRAQWLGNLTLTETWRPHVFGPERNVFTGVAWSLCFEEQFYALCFLALCLAPRRMATALAGITAAVAAVRVYAWWVDGLDGLSGAFPLLWHQFAVGLVVYYRLNRAREPRARRLIELGLVALLAVGLAAHGRETATAAGFGLALIALRRRDARRAAVSWLAPFRACGRRCSSIYLAHLPASVVGNQALFELGVTSFWGRVLVMIPLVSAAGVGLGWAFHAAVESHFLGAPRMPRPLPALRAAGAALAQTRNPIAWPGRGLRRPSHPGSTV